MLGDAFMFYVVTFLKVKIGKMYRKIKISK